jgi:hypothetical protein
VPSPGARAQARTTHGTVPPRKRRDLPTPELDSSARRTGGQVPGCDRRVNGLYRLWCWPTSMANPAVLLPLTDEPRPGQRWPRAQSRPRARLPGPILPLFIDFCYPAPSHRRRPRPP